MNLFRLVTRISNDIVRNAVAMSNDDEEKTKKVSTSPLGTICDKYKVCKNFKGEVLKETDIMGIIEEFGYCENYQFCEECEERGNTEK